MSSRFEELAWQDTPIGEISLRRRLDPALQTEVYEVKLGDEFLMSSLFTVAEIALSRLGLAALTGTDLDVVVGGLGLGYTAQAALDDDRVRSVLVVDAVDAVIDWHQRGLLPFADLGKDPRCRLLHGDFFALTATPAGYDEGRQFDAVLLDVDHSPRHLLHPRHAPFYTADGLRQLARHLRPGGVFGLWSNDPPDEPFLSVLTTVFPTARAEVVEFDNPLQHRLSTNTIYLAGPA